MAVQPDELAKFCQLLQALLSGDNEHRKASEALYQSTKQCDADRLCRCLITVLAAAPDETLRQQSAVLLRQCLKATRVDFVWPHLPLATQEAIKEQLIVALRRENFRPTRHKVCDVVSMLACHVLDPSAAATQGGGWPEIGQVLGDFVEASESGHRESALRIVKDMLTNNPLVVQAMLSGKMSQLLQVCHCDSSPQVRKEAVLLFAAALEHLDTAEWEPLRRFMPQMLAVVKQFETSEDELLECLEAFVQLLEYAPGAFQMESLETAVQMMSAISRAREQLQDGVRQMAFEFLVSLCEKRSKACGKISGFPQNMVHLCMEFMLELEEEEDWATATDSYYVDASNYDVGEENIDRFAKALGAEVVLDHVFGIVRQFVNQESWKHRYVAVMTLSQCAETVQEEGHVDEIAQLLVSLLRDQHPRVRWAALHAIGQTSTDHSPYFQETHSELILPVLSRLMEDPVVKVSSHACAAFVNFAEDCEYELLLPYVPDLMSKLAQRMVPPAPLLAREQAITAVAVIAGVIETDFVGYYQEVVPVLKHTVLSATAREERALRGKAFECLSLLGMAVGREVFQQDAKEAMQAMMETAARGLEADDPQKTYIHEAAQRICRALKEQFLPYLQYLLPGIYAMLQMQPVEVIDPDLEEGEEDMTLDILADGKAVGLKTSQIEDFQNAVQMLACFIEVLGGHYFDHVRDTARCLLPALSFRFSDDVKREAIQTWQELINAAKVGLQQRQMKDDEGLVAELLRAYLRCTMEAMAVEEDLEVLQVQAIGTTQCIRAGGPGSMSAEEVQQLCTELRRLLEEATERHWAAAEPNSTEGIDEDEVAQQMHQRDTDQMLRVKLAELVGAVAEVHREHFIASGLQHFVPVLQGCLAPGRTPSDRCIAFYLASDFLEKLGQDSLPLWSIFISQMLEATNDEDPWVRQAAAYGVLHAAPLHSFRQLAGSAAGLLTKAVAHPGARWQGNREATEAGIAALGRLCRMQADHISNVDQYLLVFLRGLPIQEDVDQAGPAHELLLEYVQEGHPVFKQHASQVIQVFLEVYGKDITSDSLNEGIRRTLLQAGEENLKRMQLSEKLRKRAQKIMRDAKRQRGS